MNEKYENTTSNETCEVNRKLLTTVVFGAICLIVAGVFVGTIFQMRILHVVIFLAVSLVVLFATFFAVKNTVKKDTVKALEEKKQVEKSNVIKTEFLAQFSHEVRTPMNAVLGAADLLSDADPTPKQVEFINMIHSSCETMVALLDNILDVAEIENDNVVLEEQEYEFNSAMYNIISYVNYRTDGTGVAFTTSIDPLIPIRLKGDIARIKQVMTILLTSSINYTTRGSISLSMKWNHLSEDKGLMNIVIKDTGGGVPEDQMALLQKMSSDSLDLSEEALENAGLELYLCYKLLKLMGGGMIIESKIKTGTTVSFYIPQTVVDGTNCGYGLRGEDQVVRPIREMIDFKAPEARIAIVDDNKVNLKVTAKILSKFEIRPVLFTSGAEFIRSIESGMKYDMIMLDHMMPDMDGVEVVKQIRESDSGSLKNTPVIAFTANAVCGVERMFAEAGMDDCLFKPLNINDLILILERWLPMDKIIYL